MPLETSDHVYYTASLRKASHDQIDDVRPLQFTDIRNQPLINKANDYEMSIIKFSVDTPTLPIFIPEITPSQGNPFQTIYSVNMSYKVGAVETFLAAPISVIFTQRDFTDIDPSPPNTNANGLQSVTRAYYSYSYRDFIEDIQTAINAAKTALDVLFPVLATYDPPTIVWNCQTDTADFYARTDSYEEGLTNRINLYISKSMYPLFSSLPVEKFPVSADRKEYRIRFNNDQTNVESNFYGIFSAVKVCQEYPCLECWAPFTSLVFTSNLLGAQTEFLSPPIIYDNGSLRAVNNNQNNYLNIITDISSQEYSMRSNLLYLPTAEYRFVSLYGNEPLYKLDFNIYCQTKLGFTVPFYLHSNSSVFLKVLFRKKQK